MDRAKPELDVFEDTSAEIAEFDISALSDLQLALVAGGFGETIL
jgi:hypothetical protein